MKRLILIDAHAIIHRAYHALPPLTTPAGEPINAVYGFTTILLRILKELKPDYCAAAFDMPGPTFRHIAYERYKAQRPETPGDLSSQFAKVHEVVEAFGISVFQKEGYEADDIIGTMAHLLKKNTYVEVMIVTGDMDALQLVRPRCTVYAMKKGITETILYDEKAVKERFGFSPIQLVDFKGLKGDPSDNIPGVKGIGEKTAVDLIKKFGTIEKLYKALKKGVTELSASVEQKLRDGEEIAFLSKELATIRRDAPIEFLLERTVWKADQKNDAARKLFQRFGFTSLLKRFARIKNFDGSPEPRGVQETLGVDITSEQKEVLGHDSVRELSTGAELVKIARASKNMCGLFLHEEKLFLAAEKQGVFVLAPSLCAAKEAKIFFNAHEWAVHDEKSIIKFLRSYGIELGAVIFDTMLAAYVTQVFNRDFSYGAVLSRELGRLVSEDIPREFVHFFDMMRMLDAKLSEGKLRFVYEKIEMPLVRILADMEKRGISIDQPFLAVFAKKVDKKIAQLTTEIHRLGGDAFNINSSQQLSRMLFEVLKIQTYGLRKTEKGGVISTRESELEKLRASHPIVEKILAYRELMKLKTTYIDVLPSMVNRDTNRLHTTFNQTGTATGRLSSANPNLQNIPILSEIGREVRKAFIAPRDFCIASFDYSQIELRLAAHMAHDEKMIEAFRNAIDIHKKTAAEIYNTSLDMVTSEQRRAAKTLNFGVLYGMGPVAFSEATGLSREDAKKFIDEYFHNFFGIRAYLEKTKHFAAENGYVETLFGRRRFISEILSSNWQMRREAERAAINAPIQGSTADLVKMAMIQVDEWIQKEKLKDDVRMLVQVHDELLFEIREKDFPHVVPKIKMLMEGVAKLKVPLVVEVKVGKNWGKQSRIGYVEKP